MSLSTIKNASKNIDLVLHKHQQIISGACRKFFEKGYHRTTIREIAIASGMSMGQLYHYISSKDDVLFLIYQHMQRVWVNHLVESGIENTVDPKEKLTKALYHTLEFMVDNKDLISFIYTETKYLEKKFLRVVMEMDDKNVVGYWRILLKDAEMVLPTDDEIQFFANLLSYLMVFLPLRGWNLRNKSDKQHLDRLVFFIIGGLEKYSKQDKL